MREWFTLVVGVLGILSAVYATRTSRQATSVSREANQIKWLQEAKDDAREAKKEADEVKDDLETTRRELSATNRELRKTQDEAVDLRDDLDAVAKWVAKVVMWAHDAELPDPELRRLINGGPPQLRHRMPQFPIEPPQ